MSRGAAVTSALAIGAAFAAAAAAAPSSRPSDRSCLIAWNAPSNHANRLRLLAARPVTGLVLVPGIVATDTWSKGSTATRTAAAACLLTFAKPGRIQVVSGAWRAGHVSRWSFGRPIPTTRPFPSNVRLLPDGRVTKIYRR